MPLLNCRKSGEDWDERFPYVLFVYRTSPQELTKELPFYLLYGLASYPGSLIMWGRKREPGDYCVAHAPNVYANFPG